MDKEVNKQKNRYSKRESRIKLLKHINYLLRKNKLLVFCIFGWIITLFLLKTIGELYKELIGAYVVYVAEAGLLIASAFLSFFIGRALEKANNTPDCNFHERMLSFGIENVFASQQSNAYQDSLLSDLEKMQTIGGELIIVGVSLRPLLSNTENDRGKDVADKIYEIANTHKVTVYMCKESSKELLLRQDVFKKLAITKKTSETPRNTINNITSVWELLQDKIAEGLCIEVFKFNDNCFPLATMCFVNDKIYFTPNVFHLENWQGEPGKNEDASRVSLLIKRRSQFGKRLEALLNVYETSSGEENNV